jgi:TP901 family phage tail tape measure protein
MAKARIPVEFDPVVTSKVDAALARIQSKAKGIDFGGGARSLEKLSRPLGKITGQATEFQKSLEASNARVLAFGASVAVINKLSQAFGALVENTIKVEATFAKINTILGGTEKQLQQFGNGIFAVAQKTATSFDDVAEGALELARQGLSVEESLSRVETALKLVRVAGVSSEQAVAGLTAAIKGFEGAGLTVAAIGDKLSEVDTKFAVSTEDLINGLERASASARVAGVSFDELLAVVTTVQERTQRGGAVIGNAFKTIFARLGRTDTLVALEDLGISVLDTQGNVRSAIPLFQELAVELNRLGLKSVEAGDIIQKVAGVRQRDILISLVEDLNSSQSQFAKALQTSATAAGALDSKNNSLNQTLEALINNLVVGGQKLASVLGELGFTDKVGDILEFFGAVVNGITDLLQGESLGAKFAQGLVRGIGGVLTVPGLALIGGIFIKLFVDLAKFGASSLGSLLGINKASQEQNALQQSVLQTLFQNENVQREILALEGNKVAQEQLLLRIYNQQVAALVRVQKAAAVVTPALFGAGLRGGSEGVTRKGGRAAGGFIASESRDVSRGVGGAPSSAKVVSIPNFAFGGGKRGTMVANTSEYVVPNYAGGGDAIFNQDMVKTMGLPAGAKKLNAAGGFIPNFAAPRSLERLRGLAKGRGPKALEAKAELANRQNQKSSQKLIYDPRFAMVVPQVLGAKQQIQGTRKGKKVAFDLVGYEPGVGSRVKNDEQLDQSTRKFALGLANQQAGLMGGPPQASKILKLANSGAISALSGTIFETAVSSLLSSKDFDSRSEISAFDFVGSGANSKLKKLFPQLGAATQIEAKIRPSPDNKKSMFDKVLKATGNAAGGYIPNFAGGALDQAVAREQSAGLPINQIRINQSGKLRNSQNPMGLAVTNTRDEPTGAIPNFASGGRSTPATPGGSSDGGFGGGLIAASTGLYFLSSAFSNAESTFGKLVSQVALAASALTTLSLLKGPVENIGAKLSGFGTQIATFNPQNPGKRAGLKGGLGRGIARVGGALPGIGTAVAIGAVLAPLVLELTKTKTGFERLNEELKNVDLKGLAEGSKEVQTAFLNTLITEKERRTTVEETKKETGIKKETLDEIFAAAAKRVGKETGFKDKEVLKSSIAALDEQTVKDLIGAAQDTNSVDIVTSGGAAGGVQGSFTSEETTLRANDLLDSLIGAIKDNIAATEELAEATAKTAREDKFGIGAVTGGKAKKDFKENIDQGRFAAGGFDTIKQLEPTKPGGIGATIVQDGALSAIRGKELDLAEAVTTVRKVGLENEIALKKFLVEKAKEEFKITEEYVKSIRAATVFSAKQKEFIEGQVKAGASLLSIQDGLVDAGIELSGAAKVDFDLAVGKAETQQEILNNKLEEVKLQQEINNLNKPQGFGEGIRKGLGNLENDIVFFGDELGENIPAQFSDNLGSAIKEAVSEAKTLDQALSDAGRNFLGFIRDAFLEQAAAQTTSLLFGSSEGKGGLSGAAKSLFGGKGGAASPDGTAGNPIYTATSASGANPVSALTGEGKGEGIFSKLKDTLMESFGRLKTTFSDLFGGLKEGLGTIFKGLTTNLGSLFTGGSGGGGIGGIAKTVLGAFGLGFANGGPVGFANGGSVGSTDTVPAMLTPGEFVMKKSAVEKYGSGFLSSINEGVMPMRGFQNGGVVSPVSAEAGTTSNSASQVTNSSDFTFNIQDGGAEQAGEQGSDDQQRDFAQKVKAAVTTVVQEESRTGGTLSYLYKK